MLSVIVFAAACSSAAESNTADVTKADRAANQAVTGKTTPDRTSSSPTPFEESSPHGDDGLQAAIDVVRRYYAAINAGEYKQAYELWSGKGEASRQSFERFRSGFRDTASVSVEISEENARLEGAAGSQYASVPVRISATKKGGGEQRFSGEYMLRRSMVDGATPEQQAWHIYSASVNAAGA